MSIVFRHRRRPFARAQRIGLRRHRFTRRPFSVLASAVEAAAQTTTALLGGFAFSGSPRWVGPNELLVPFTSTYGTARFHQLYAGRTLVGVTSNPSDREVRAIVEPSHYGQPLQLVAVEPLERLEDVGSFLPPRPYNKAKLEWDAENYSDCEAFEVTAGTEPGGAVDATNILKRVLFDRNRRYEYVTPPLDGSGTWNFEVTPYDTAELDGNAGTALAIQVTGVLAHPPDVAFQSDGSRLAGEIAGGVITIDFDYDW